MTAAGIHRLLVLDKGRLCGIVTTTDITRAVSKGQITPERDSRRRPTTERSGR
jgi:CBS domain-containing protein